MSKYHTNSIELEIMDVNILMDMENKLLKGSRHMKRGEGITKVDMDRFTEKNVPKMKKTLAFQTETQLIPTVRNTDEGTKKVPKVRANISEYKICMDTYLRIIPSLLFVRV